MPACYLHFNDGWFAGQDEFDSLLPGNATLIPPPEGPWQNLWPRLVDGVWQLRPDHRERPAEIFGPNAQAPTPFWLPGDSWDSPPRKMTSPGPLPEGAILERPPRPEAELLACARREKLAEIDAAYEAALAASLTMPQGEPSLADVAVGAALFAQEDAEGLEYVASRHQERRAALASLAAAAATLEEVAAIQVSYAV